MKKRRQIAGILAGAILLSAPVVGWTQERLPGEVPTAVPAPPSLRGGPGNRAQVAPSGPRERIRPEFLPGQTYRFVSSTELRSPLGQMEIEQQMRFDAKVRVDGEDGVVLRATTERLDATLRSGSSVFAFESLDPADRETLLGRHFQGTLNRFAEFTLDPDLRIAAASEGGREQPEALLPGVPRFGPDELARILVSLRQGVPARAVAAGEVWTVEGSRSAGNLGLLDFSVTYRFAGPVVFEGHSCLAVEFAGTLTGSLPMFLPDAAEGGGGLAAVQSPGIRGRLLFDPLDRMLRRSEEDMDLSLTLPAAEGAEPQVIPVSQKTTVRLLHVVATP